MRDDHDDDPFELGLWMVWAALVALGVVVLVFGGNA